MSIELKEYVGYEAELKESEAIELDDEAVALQNKENKEPEQK